MYNHFNTQILTRVQPETRQVVGCLDSCMVLLCIILDVRSCDFDTASNAGVF